MIDHFYIFEDQTDMFVKTRDILNEKILMFDYSRDLKNEQNTII